MLSSNGGDGSDKAVVSPFAYSEKFEECFPYYMALGMSAEQYWDSDPTWVRAFREADRLRTDRKNQEQWLMGNYIYQAILCCTPVLHAFAKSGTKPAPYLSEPFPLSKEQVAKSEKNRERSSYDKNKAIVEGFMVAHNKKFKGGG